MKNLFYIFLLLFTQGVFAAPFEGVCDGITDDAPALTAQILSASQSADKEIVFPARQCAFYSAPAALVRGVSLIGQGKSNTVLIRKFNGNFLTIYEQGSRVESLTIYADPGTSGGIGIYMVSSEARGAGGNHVVRSVWITGIGTWVVPLFGDGTLKTTAPKGLRAVTLTDVSVFNATFWAYTCWDCVSVEWFGGGAYQGFGTTQAVAIGGPQGALNYVNANIDYAASTIYPEVMRKQP